MVLTAKELEIVNKYLPEDKINDILNFNRLVNYICNYHKTTIEILAGKKRNREISYVRMILVAMTVKIFAPKQFENFIFRNKKVKIPKGVFKLSYIIMNKNPRTCTYFFDEFKKYNEINQINMNELNKMELEILNTFEYKK